LFTFIKVSQYAFCREIPGSVELGVIVGTSIMIGNVASHSGFLGIVVMEMQTTLQAGGNAEKIVSKIYL